jgi:hypothetical protein
MDRGSLLAALATQELLRQKYAQVREPGNPVGYYDNGDRQFALEHRYGYGLTDNPSPWGYNRDVYNAEHPHGPPQGYYNPYTGVYDSKTEIPFTVSGPRGPELIGTGGPPVSLGGPVGYGPGTGFDLPWAMTGHMGGLPTGGNADTDPQYSAMPVSWDGAMANLPTGGNTDAQPAQSSDLTYQQLADMLSTYMENASTSSGG